MQNRFNTIDGETLMNKPLMPIRFVVQSLIPQGLSILAGTPKTGKSWLALWLCLQIAKGEDVGHFKTEKGTTLYLCLEDSENRIQSRLFDITDNGSDNAYFTIASNAIGNGLEQQLENFVKEHPDTNFIVIDTLQKIRKISYDNAYANDYRELSILKSITDKLDVAVLLIHHLRKQGDTDPVNMISGTTGLTGAVDGLYVLKKDSRRTHTAKFIATGRDIEDREFTLDFDKVNHIWNFVSDDSAEPFSFSADDAIVEIVDFIKAEEKFVGTASELAEKMKTNVRPNILSKKLTQNQMLLTDMGITVSFSRTGKKRELMLKYEPLANDFSDGNDDNDGKNVIGYMPDLLSQPSLPSQVE